jgi:hypothetical protein
MILCHCFFSFFRFGCCGCVCLKQIALSRFIVDFGPKQMSSEFDYSKMMLESLAIYCADATGNFEKLCPILP